MKFVVKVSPQAGRKLAEKLTRLAKRANSIASAKVAEVIAESISAAAESQGQGIASAYKHALTEPGVVTLKEDAISVDIKDPLVKAIEDGAESWDIKSKMLAKAKKFSKAGVPYVDVPFKHAITRGSVTKQVMPADVAKEMRTAVKSAEQRIRAFGGSDAEAKTARVRLRKQTPGAEFERKLRIGGDEVSTRVQHRRGIHDDMIRSARIGKKDKVQSKYTTIRRISKNSDQWSWWHPGFPGRHIMRGSIPGIKRGIASAIREAYQSVGLKARVVLK